MKFALAHDHHVPTGVLGLDVLPDASMAVAASADGTIYRVDLTSGDTQPLQQKHASFASACVLLPNGRTVISGGYEGTVLWHDIPSGRSIRTIQAHRFWNWQMALSPDGSRLATVTGQYLPGGWKYEPAPESEPSLKVFDTATGELKAAFSHIPPVLSCAFSPDGRYVAAANMMGEVRVWDWASGDSGKPVSQWTSPDFTSWGTTKTHHYCGGIYALAFSPDGNSLVGCGMGPMGDPMAGNGKMTWQRWNWRTGEQQDQIKDGQHGSGLMEALVWHPDGKSFLMAGRQAQGTWNAALFAAAGGSLIHSVDTKKRITQARFGSDGKKLILAGATGQGEPKDGKWPTWGRIQVYDVEM